MDFKNISDLTGIEYLSALEDLSAQFNNLHYVDVSKNQALFALFLNGNPLVSLDLTKNPGITCYDLCTFATVEIPTQTPLAQLDPIFDVTCVQNLRGSNFNGGFVNFTSEDIYYTYAGDE